MEVNQFDFELPESLIAQTPLENRTTSKLLTLNRQSGEIIHDQFTNLVQYLNAGDTIVLNDTKVIPARLIGVKQGTGARVEFLLLRDLGGHRWEALVRPGKRLRKGTVVLFGADSNTGEALLSAVIEDEGEMGARIVQFQFQGIFQELLDQLGQMPLPPYIKTQLSDKTRYQTVYAKNEGSAAAPTAGLHFSQSYLEMLQQKGISIAYVTLHVGLGTFRPVSADNIKEHEMHSEYYSVSEETAQLLNATRKRGGRIVAVGTTSVRTLETVASQCEGEIKACKGWTSIFIYPGYSFQLVDAMLTNFHLPKSTLLMLISAFATREQILHAYQEAIERKYRFFSFGDAMFLY